METDKIVSRSLIILLNGSNCKLCNNTGMQIDKFMNNEWIFKPCEACEERKLLTENLWKIYNAKD